MPQNHLIFAGIVLAFYLLVQAFENQYIVPRVLGDAVELPPLVVLVGVLVGGSIAGILGALIAVPVIGTGKEVISYLYGKIIEAPAIEAPPPLEPGLIGNLKNFGRRFAGRLFGPPAAGA
jgi:predicted PurR-regulated permease PerM